MDALLGGEVKLMSSGNSARLRLINKSDGTGLMLKNITWNFIFFGALVFMLFPQRGFSASETPNVQVGALRSGEAVVAKHCSICHGNPGIPGAPRVAGEWKPRVAGKGIDSLVASTIKGKNAMPPKGMCMDCTSAELRDAIAVLVYGNSKAEDTYANEKIEEEVSVSKAELHDETTVLAHENKKIESDASISKIDFRKAWFKPELIENNDPECDDILKDAQDKFFSPASFGAAYGIQGYGYSKTGTILDWTIVTGETQGQIEAYGKTFYLDYINNSGCGGACETNQPLVSDKPFPEERDYSYLKELSADAPPAASYSYTIAETPKKMFYLFIVGSSQEYKNQLLIYKLAPEARWKSACKISLAPKDIKQIEDADLSLAIDSVNDLNQSISPLSGGAGNCGSMGTAWRWKKYVSDSLEQALYRPWALNMSRKYPSANSSGDYSRISQQLETWSLGGVADYKAFSSYKSQLQKSISDISIFYKKKYGWSEQQSKAMAEEALTSAISRGFGFYMYEPFKSDNERKLRAAILSGNSLNEIKQIPWSEDFFDYNESLLNISIFSPDITEFLLDKKVDPNQLNNFGKTPLMYAAQYNQIDSAKILIKHGASTVSATTKPYDTCYYTLQTFNMTPLHYAVRYASPDFIKLLLDNGAAPFMKAENHRKRPIAEETPLDWLYRYTAADSPEKNPNIPDEKIAEVEKWLQSPSSDEIATKADDYLVSGEKEYQAGNYSEAYSYFKKVISLDKNNVRAMNNYALAAYKLGLLGEAAQTSQTVIDLKDLSSQDKAPAYFNMALVCKKVNQDMFEKEKRRDKSGYLFTYNAKTYCQTPEIDYLIDSFKASPAQSRSNAILNFFSDFSYKKHLCADGNHNLSIYRSSNEFYFLTKSDGVIDNPVIGTFAPKDRTNSIDEGTLGLVTSEVVDLKNGYSIGVYMGQLNYQSEAFSFNEQHCTRLHNQFIPKDAHVVFVESKDGSKVNVNTNFKDDYLVILYGDTEWNIHERGRESHFILMDGKLSDKANAENVSYSYNNHMYYYWGTPNKSHDSASSKVLHSERGRLGKRIYAYFELGSGSSIDLTDELVNKPKIITTYANSRRPYSFEFHDGAYSLLIMGQGSWDVGQDQDLSAVNELIYDPSKVSVPDGVLSRIKHVRKIADYSAFMIDNGQNVYYTIEPPRTEYSGYGSFTYQ